MSKLAYLDLAERNGELHPKLGTLQLNDLATDLVRRAERSLQRRRYRAFTRMPSGDEATLQQLARMLAAVRKAAEAVLTDLRRSRKIATDRPVFLSVDAGRKPVEVLASLSAEDNVDGWLRTAGPEATLVELQDVDEQGLEHVQASLAGEPPPAPEVRPEVTAGQRVTNVVGPIDPSLANAAAQRRRELAALWLDAADVCAKLGYSGSNPSQATKALRNAGKLLGVWVPHERDYRYPPWQFRNAAAGALSADLLITEMQPILALIRDHDARGAGVRRRSGWSEATWFMAANALLGAKLPKDLLAGAPERVVEAARQQFEEAASHPRACNG